LIENAAAAVQRRTTMSSLTTITAMADLVIAVIAIALSVPLVLGKVGMNPLYGVRFPRSFESDELWYRINRYGGRRLIVWSIAVALVALGALAWPAILGWLAPLAPLFYIVAGVEAWRYTRSLPRD